MSITAAMALVCYISSNPSPQQWLVSGRAEAVARMDAKVAGMGEIRRIAHAEDGDTAFSRYEMGANPPNRILWILLRDAERDRMIYSRFQHVVASCPSGERSRVGQGGADLIMAVIGPPAAVRKLGIAMRRSDHLVRLEDGRTGFGFTLNDADRDRYDELVRRAAAGQLPGVDLVLTRPNDAEPPPDPPYPDGTERVPARTNLDHLGS